ncbi:MAG: insulinase family protein [Saprospiraceae bacterium]|nr:insulinase family protein [Saprospiraceae bacterium]
MRKLKRPPKQIKNEGSRKADHPNVGQKVQDRKTTSPNVVSPPPLTFDYESVPGDPLGVKIYTLKNGMKLYMSINDAEPRIQTNMPVRAGSKHDPAETTGLAHYLEHMMFKGTSNVGALNWAEEQKPGKNLRPLRAAPQGDRPGEAQGDLCPD